MKLSPVEALILRMSEDAWLKCRVYMDDYYRDNGLTPGTTGSTFAVRLNNAEADTYTEATTTFILGTKTTPTLSVVNGTVDGRAIQITAFTDGSVTNSGTASHWALVDVTNTRLVCAGPLSGTQSVTSGNTWSLGTFQATVIRDAA
jgi:hypothetical protein